MMTLRSKGLKLIIAVSVIMLAILVFNANIVKAENLSDEQKQSILNLIPNEINLDLKEIEFKKAQDAISNQIVGIMKNNYFEITDNNIYVNTSPIYYNSIDKFYTASVYINMENKQISKTINVTYNNHSDYNLADETYVKNLNIEMPKYIGVDVKMCTNATDYLNELGRNFTKLINDKSIKIVLDSGAMGGEPESPLEFPCDGYYMAIFKNDVLYDIRSCNKSQPFAKLTIPSNVKDTNEAYIEYATPIVTEIIRNIDNYHLSLGDIYKNCTVSITKGTDISLLKNVENVYTIKIENVDVIGNAKDTIILEKEKKNEANTVETNQKATAIAIATTDTTTNIKLDTTSDVVPSGTVLKAEKVTAGNNYNVVVKALGSDVAKFEMFDISLSNNNTKIQPNGKVKVSIPVPAGFNTSKIAVYYVAEDGTKTKIDATVKDGYIVFETDHFSNYVVAEENDTSTKTKDTTNTNTSKTEAEVKTSTNTTVIANTSENASQSTQTSTKTQNTTNTRKLDNTPKTGLENNITPVVTAIISSLSAVCLAVIKRF